MQLSQQLAELDRVRCVARCARRGVLTLVARCTVARHASAAAAATATTTTAEFRRRRRATQGRTLCGDSFSVFFLFAPCLDVLTRNEQHARRSNDCASCTTRSCAPSTRSASRKSGCKWCWHKTSSEGPRTLPRLRVVNWTPSRHVEWRQTARNRCDRFCACQTRRRARRRRRPTTRCQSPCTPSSSRSR